MRQTLRSNNRQLAKALESVRQELNRAQQQNLDLQHEQQHMMTHNNNLQRVAGLRNDEIDTEVNFRVKVMHR